jgi:hypothetical protein
LPSPRNENAKLRLFRKEITRDARNRADKAAAVVAQIQDQSARVHKRYDSRFEILLDLRTEPGQFNVTDIVWQPASDHAPGEFRKSALQCHRTPLPVFPRHGQFDCGVARAVKQSLEAQQLARQWRRTQSDFRAGSFQRAFDRRPVNAQNPLTRSQAQSRRFRARLDPRNDSGAFDWAHDNSNGNPGRTVSIESVFRRKNPCVRITKETEHTAERRIELYFALRFLNNTPESSVLSRPVDTVKSSVVITLADSTPHLLEDLQPLLTYKTRL